MKKSLQILIAFAFISLNAASQIQLLGTTFLGGSHGYGTIFKINEDGTGFNVYYSFDSISGFKPLDRILRASNNQYYGICFKGGVNNYGVIYSFDSALSNYTVVHNFDSVSGAAPYTGLVEAQDHKLYGVVQSGPTNNACCGILYSFDPSNNVYTVLHNFNDANSINTTGWLPNGSPLCLNNKLYGMTTAGGINDDGLIYSYDLNTNTFTDIHDFDNTHGQEGNGLLVLGNDGKLYGMTNKGGTANNYGLIFSLDTSNYTYTSLHDFDNTNGSFPADQCGMIKAPNDKLYGMTMAGGLNNEGVLFSFDPSNNTYTNLHNFDSLGGHFTAFDLMHASNGRLYGCAGFGGSSGYGTIFSYDITSNTYAVIHNFDSINGDSPRSVLLEINILKEGIPNINNANMISLFPNPATNLLTIHISKLTIPQSKILILDVFGRIIFQRIITENDTKIDVSEWSSGVYFYELNGLRGKIIKE